MFGMDRHGAPEREPREPREPAREPARESARESEAPEAGEARNVWDDAIGNQSVGHPHTGVRDGVSDEIFPPFGDGRVFFPSAQHRRRQFNHAWRMDGGANRSTAQSGQQQWKRQWGKQWWATVTVVLFRASVECGPPWVEP